MPHHSAKQPTTLQSPKPLNASPATNLTNPQQFLGDQNHNQTPNQNPKHPTANPNSALSQQQTLMTKDLRFRAVLAFAKELNRNKWNNISTI